MLETRDITAAPLPGKSLVAYSPRHDAICDFFPIEDGHANERSALDDVLETVKRRQLWLADRNFCTVKFMYGIIAAGAAFIIRQHETVGGTASGRLLKIGKTDSGTVYEQLFDLPEHNGVLLIAVPEDEWVAFGKMCCEAFTTEIAKVAAKVNVKRYAKSVRGPKIPKPKKKHAKRVVHVTTKKILDQRRKGSC